MLSLLPSFMVVTLPFMFLSNPSIIFLWIMLEMSSIMFICMVLSEDEVKKKEWLLVYFLVQSFASVFLLVFLFSSSSFMSVMFLENSNNKDMIVSILIAFKIGMAPLHFWMVKMSKMMSWFSMGALLTWQKLIPLSFLMSFPMNYLMMLICLASLLMGTLSQLKLTSLKMLIVFSSISHLGWMVSPFYKCSLMTLSYLLMYSMIILPLMKTFLFSNYLYLFNQISFSMVILMTMLILSLSGIPPLMGFLLKWMALTFMAQSTAMMMLFSLMACMSFYIYIRMIYKMFLLSPFSFIQTNIISKMNSIWMINLMMPLLIFLW